MLIRNKEELKKTIRNIPSEPGVYKYFNKENELIYIGKAKHLRKRVTSYFLDLKNKDRKTQRLVSQIHSIQFTVVTSEYEALLLENNLIKAFKPKYNILLRDDKSFPFICIPDEAFPRLLTTRRPELYKKAKFFGPYTSVGTMNDLVDSIRKIFKLRTCDLNLSSHNILANKYKVCLEYHVDNCKGPCVSYETKEAYQEKIKQVVHILKGNYAVAKEFLQQQMTAAAERLKFEEAEGYKQSLYKINLLEQKSVILNPDLGNLIVLGILSNDVKATVSVIHVQYGTIVQTYNVDIKKKLHESNEEILFHAYLKATQNLPVDENKDITIISNITPLWIKDIAYDWQVPKIGDKKKILDISLKNAFIELNKRIESDSNKRYTQAIEILQKELSLKELPLHIECFDNSNIQGTNPVASMVCFKNGKPSKRDYRHFNIKTVEGPDDFASMKEVVGRRYKRLIEEQAPLPSLIVIDGGKGQLNAAIEALKEVNIYGLVPVIGLAKRLEEIFFPGDQESIILGRRSEGLKLLQNLRNEAHRFAITFHRKKRSKNTFNQSVLHGIEGIGPNTAQKLLITFKTIDKIKAATIEELSNVIGKSKATIIKEKL
ncbi:MAG TPA: excinuclease ABC subunit UvrC [Cytophagaceae bacterium]|jgi:excinuclease ABC subunit C|nr:excinuclease ABC subunit UvrC [Cytophagaceae bacterium]